MRIMYDDYGVIQIVETKRMYKTFDLKEDKFFLSINIPGFILKFDVPEDKIVELLEKTLKTGFLNLTKYKHKTVWA